MNVYYISNDSVLVFTYSQQVEPIFLLVHAHKLGKEEQWVKMWSFLFIKSMKGEWSKSLSLIES